MCRDVNMKDKNKKIYIAGHTGMVGSAILRRLKLCSKIDIITTKRDNLDLTDQKSVLEFFDVVRPDEVIIAAAKVGGVFANNEFPADFIFQNLQIQNNLIHAAHVYNVQKLLFLGSSCIYPREAEQPIREESLLTGPLEPTNEPYAIAKIAGIKMCESYNRQYGRDYRCVMPTNLYGPGDNYHPEHSHVVPSLIRRFHEAKINNDKEVCVWGSGTPRREFLFVDDMAEACLLIHNLEQIKCSRYTKEHLSLINIGSGKDLSIRKLAEVIKKIVQFQGDITFDGSKLDGTPRKLLDGSILTSIGWQSKINLLEGIQISYKDFQNRYSQKSFL